MTTTHSAQRQTVLLTRAAHTALHANSVQCMRTQIHTNACMHACVHVHTRAHSTWPFFPHHHHPTRSDLTNERHVLLVAGQQGGNVCQGLVGLWHKAGPGWGWVGVGGAERIGVQEAHPQVYEQGAAALGMRATQESSKEGERTRAN